MSQAQTIIISESDMPRIKDTAKPYVLGDVRVTRAMTRLASNLIRDPTETARFIAEIENG